ncbi:MAG: sugar transferase [Ignavibacteria bacterium]|nr:sugar transferase [Ignavibacteria bacterium]
MTIICLTLKIASNGPVIHWSKRVGKDNKMFYMAKLRTMRNDAPELASNVFKKTDEYLIFLGKFLRITGIDELPQLYNILRGDMSIVGPRPALFNFDEIISLREDKNINTIKPGLTGLAQICGRNSLSTAQKVILDEYYLLNMNPMLDFKIFFLTIINIFRWDKNSVIIRKIICSNTEI